MTGTMALACALAAWPAAAQVAQEPPPVSPDGRRVVAIRPQTPDPLMAARIQLARMEGLLEVAVEHGAVMLSRQFRGAMPGMLMMGGTARARGFRLDGYGVFFDVEVPALSQSMMWSWRVLERDTGGAASALETLKGLLNTVSDPAARRDLDQAIRTLELRVSPLSPSVLDRARGEDAAKPGERVAVQVEEAPAPPLAGSAGPEDPSVAYTQQVRDALIDTMLDYSQALTIGPDEFLTVAARDNQSRAMPGGDPYDTMTIIIRVSGRDLAEFRAGRISREETLARVQVREY